jgi:hypothetical protein
MTPQQNEVKSELTLVQTKPSTGALVAVAPGITHVQDVHGRTLRRMRLAGLIALALGALALMARPSVFTAPSGLEGAASAEPALAAVILPSANSKIVANPPSIAGGEAGTVTGLAAKDEQNLVSYLARKWRVADAAVQQIVQTAVRASKEHRVDPMLVLAVLSVESGFNPYAESHAGAQGLMQVMTSVHKEKFARFGGEDAALHPVANVFVGAQILADVVQRGGSMEQGLKLYVGAGNLETDGGYGARVLGERTRLVNALRGKYDFTSPGFGNPPVASAQGAMIKTAAPDAAKPAAPAPTQGEAGQAVGKDAEAKLDKASEKVAAAI